MTSQKQTSPNSQQKTAKTQKTQNKQLVIDPHHKPQTKAEFNQCLQSRMWRLHNLYTIKDKRAQLIKFQPNQEQLHLLKTMHTRNIILKVRQLGISTFWLIYMLDAALFYPGVETGCIAHTREDAQELFENKVKLAYEHLPDAIQNMHKQTSDSARKLAFSNGSSVRIGTSFRSGTPVIVLVSEFGRLSAEAPDQAREIKTGTFNAVPENGILVVESTAYGRQGLYYDLVQDARRKAAEGTPLSPYDWKFYFFDWITTPQYSLDPSFVNVSQELEDYFARIEEETGYTIPPEKRAWYAAKSGNKLSDDMKQEFPSCIAVGEPVAAKSGIRPINECLVGQSPEIMGHYPKNNAPVYKLRTKLGYELVGTDDHPIKTTKGFKFLRDLTDVDAIMLQSYAIFGGSTQKVMTSHLPLESRTIEISEDLAEFIGFFVGDGSFYAKQNTLSIACDNKDSDVIERVSDLMHDLFGSYPRKRLIGKNKGCAELRLSNKKLFDVLTSLGLLYYNGSCYKRLVTVPNYILTGPTELRVKFLRGLFEADGFVQRSGRGVKFFSKSPEFSRYVQLLLLSLGITSRRSEHRKKSGNYEYTGYEITLRTEESLAFYNTIGFVSNRKRERLEQISTAQLHGRRLPMNYLDSVDTIEYKGYQQVYDITTESGEFSCGGIMVHNSPDEAFEQTIEGAIFKREMEETRQDKRIIDLKPHRKYMVDTVWDIGYRDATAIIFFQMIPPDRILILDYYENNFENLAHYAKILQEKRDKMNIVYGSHFGPHDLEKHDLTTGFSIDDFARDLGINFTVIPKASQKQDLIESARRIFPQCWFDRKKTTGLINCLDNHRYEKKPSTEVYSDKPRKDWTTHGADAFEYLAYAVENLGGSSRLMTQQHADELYRRYAPPIV